jgi:hypothetical protein
MTELFSRPFHVCVVIAGLCLVMALPGCGGNSNEAEFLRTAPPTKPAEPESVASRRERTKSVPGASLKGQKKTGGS